MIAIFIAFLLAWSWVCMTAGKIYEQRRRLRELDQADREDMTARRFAA